jgi:hypothetical protein
MRGCRSKGKERMRELEVEATRRGKEEGDAEDVVNVVCSSDWTMWDSDASELIDSQTPSIGSPSCRLAPSTPASPIQTRTPSASCADIALI